MMEIARTFGILIKDGFKPLRNIYFASWDGEESLNMFFCFFSDKRSIYNKKIKIK